MNDWKRDPWCQYLPLLHRQLASPDIESGLPRSFISLNFEQTCAWWESLRYLLRALVGWRCIPAGLAWWYEAGRPELADPRLAMILERWNTRDELDYFAGREWKINGHTGTEEDDQIWRVEDYEPSDGWWRAFKERGPLDDHDPYYGGSNPLHLSHSDSVGLSRPEGESVGTHNQKRRRATLVVSSFGSWRRELEDYGESLPHLGDRSWYIEVIDREVGCLGTFRKSRVTGLWFQGKHSIHVAGNLPEY